ncbi:AAC(3) family N-acetyltransferase [Herbidospora mongoliensis]|uniref:AAC(3) family N-acetyltransferase n=1 Tax=Herbidospora mongoliensis TaxID=688067 RepID=UPI0008310725|nr:AAC(3) family N-acetyltransferase [Herbidospora mongoliensis]
MILTEHLDTAVHDLDLAGRPVMLHTSLRSFGTTVDADTLLDVLLKRACTVMVPAFTEPQFALPASAGPARNGVDYTTVPAGTAFPEGPAYSVDCGLINPHLGVLPAVLIGRAGAVRGRHPLNSFAAVGPQAAELMEAQSPDDVYGPIRELADRDGAILLVGVGLNRLTALHLAEQRSGRRLFLRWARDEDGEVRMVEVGSCSEGFPRLEPALRPIARTTTVGASRWHAYPARQVLAAATAAIAADQDITHCADSGCLLCRDAIAGGPQAP